MTAETIVRPEGHDHRAVGNRFWTVQQCEKLEGRTVEIRDWYATFQATVGPVAQVSDRGFVSLLTLTYQGREGTVTRPFSLNVTREIAILD